MLLANAGLAQAITLDLPPTAQTAATITETLTSYALPIGPFANGQMTTRRIEGPLTQTAWRIDSQTGRAPGTLELLAPLRAQILQGGYQTVYECDATECGGFDFRYGTSILPEPEMHVDLGDFRYFAAARGDEVISLIISRTSAAGFVQMTHVGGSGGAAPVLTASTKAGAQVVPANPTAPLTDAAPAPSDLGRTLVSGGAVALDDLVFASGSSSLTEGSYASLADLAAWLQANPEMTIALVGHTDASGGLEGNIALSRKRADSVRARLIETYDVPTRQVEAQGVGYLSPRASNLTEAGRNKNRRVEVILTSTQVKP